MGTSHPQRALGNGVNMFAHIEIRLTLTALDDEQVATLVDLCEKRCPLHGTLAAGLPIDVTHDAEAAWPAAGTTAIPAPDARGGIAVQP